MAAEDAPGPKADLGRVAKPSRLDQALLQATETDLGKVRTARAEEEGAVLPPGWEWLDDLDVVDTQPLPPRHDGPEP